MPEGRIVRSLSYSGLFFVCLGFPVKETADRRQETGDKHGNEDDAT